jgi:hypothetical protein
MNTVKKFKDIEHLLPKRLLRVLDTHYQTLKLWWLLYHTFLPYFGQFIWCIDYCKRS